MRVEVLSGVERRRQWSDDEKARIIEETLVPGARVAEVARRNAVGATLKFGCRHWFRSRSWLSLPRSPRFHQRGPCLERSPGLIEIELRITAACGRPRTSRAGRNVDGVERTEAVLSKDGSRDEYLSGRRALGATRRHNFETRYQTDDLAGHASWRSTGKTLRDEVTTHGLPGTHGSTCAGQQRIFADRDHCPFHDGSEASSGPQKSPIGILSHLPKMAGKMGRRDFADDQ